MASRAPSGLYVILDHTPAPTRPVSEIAGAALAAGIRFFQYRAKEIPRRAAYDTASRLRELTRRTEAVLIINDQADLAMAVEADGVHLGQEDLPLSVARKLLGGEAVIGVSVHTLEQLRAAEAGGADYLGIGPVFPSPTKTARPPIGCEALKSYQRAAHIPVIAIGGITVQNLPEVMACGVAGVAVISAVASQPDMKRAAAELLAAIRKP